MRMLTRARPCTCWHLRQARVKIGDVVAIYGATGGLGVHAVQLAARVFGAGKVIAVARTQEKLKLAEKLGADETISTVEEDPVEKIRDVTHGKQADVALEFVGLKKTIEQAINSVGKGGRVVIVGIYTEEIRISPYNNILLKETEIMGCSDHLRQEMPRIIELIRSGKIDLSRSITHRVPLDEVNRGIEILEKKIGNPIRVVATP